MSDQLINLLSEVKTFIPWVSFVAGLGGSLHCVGMCGGLVTATCQKSPDVLRYQVGRLLGYLLLGLLAGTLGSFLNFKTMPFYVSLIPALSIGLLFIYWGFQNYRGRKAELPMPEFMHKTYGKLWTKLVFRNQNFTKAFFTGFISIMLPCGLLYGLVLSTVALTHITEALTSMFFFWLGTVPSMVVAPQIIQRFLKPLKASLPKTYAISLMMIGVMTITFRVAKLRNVRQDSANAHGSSRMSCH